MIEPPIVEFEVAVEPDHAFEMWTARTDLWWPRSHTVGGDRGTTVHVEPGPGGRIYERDSDGVEHIWGTISDWEPPRRLAYPWHLFFPPAEATDVEVTFRASDQGTAVRITQTGWERLGDLGEMRRARTHEAWAAITGLYLDATDTTG